MRDPTLVIQAWEMLPSDSVEDAASFAAFYSVWVQIHGLPVDSIQAGIWVQNPWGEKRGAELMKVESSREAIDVPSARRIRLEMASGAAQGEGLHSLE